MASHNLLYSGRILLPSIMKMQDLYVYTLTSHFNTVHIHFNMENVYIMGDLVQLAYICRLVRDISGLW